VLLASMNSAAATRNHPSPLTVLYWNIYVVPEPAAALPIGLAGALLFLRRRRPAS